MTARPAPHDWDQQKTDILASNTAQGVHKHLQTLESNRERVLQRWIWELLQNARDVSDGNASLIASVKWQDGELTFHHDGRGFEDPEITHLIYYGSTKLERDEPIGQFGSGFLATHMLSRTVEVSGRLTDGQTFAFRLDRRGESVEDLQDRMDASFEAFKSSLAPAADGVASGAPTTFRYPIDERALKAVNQGRIALELAGPYVTAFNQQFKRIEFVSAESGIVIELRKRGVLADHIQEVEVGVSARDGAPPTVRSHVVAELEGVAVGVPFVRHDGEVALESPSGVPKLLLGFPLIGTEDFSLPAVVHSLRFSPTEERDGVYLGQGDDQANHENQRVLEQACRLLRLIAGFAAESGWSSVHRLAQVPPVHSRRWLNEDWLRGCLREHVVEPIRTTPMVVSESGVAIAPSASKLPTAKSPEMVDQLWSLAWALTDVKETLPRQAEAAGWCNAARSWAALYDCRPRELDETMNGRDLAGHAAAAGSIKALQALLREDVDAASWLDELYGFLIDEDFGDALRELQIIPNQNGEFSSLRELHRDVDIPSELKEIALLVGWDLRAELRDAHLGTLSDQPGLGDFDSDQVIPRLIDRVRERMQEPLDADTKAASVRLFGWITAHSQWKHLDNGFPAFSVEGKIIKLRREEDATERPLAPVGTWPEPLRMYAALFPGRHMLAEDFANAPDSPSCWSDLEQEGFLRTRVLYTRKEQFNAFLPDEPLPDDDEADHKTDGAIEVTDIAFLLKKDHGVVDWVRQNPKRARLFWDFLTRWLAIEDAQGLEAQESACVCGEHHSYYPAAWLVPLARRQWVPLSDRRTARATARSLANLVRDSGWSADLQWTNPKIVALLSALRISVTELIKELLTTDDEERTALDEKLAQLLTSVGSEWECLFPVLAENMEEYKQRRRRGQENQNVGRLVETLVRESLEDEGFHVQRTGWGSDFEIRLGAAADDEQQFRLELTRDERTWLVEIKSARDDSVKMTSVQARTAVEEESRYLLCVVPISGPEDLDQETVRKHIRFVDGIGERLADRCNDMDGIEDIRKDVTEDKDGLRLELDLASWRIRVARAVWEGGFGLEDLLARLTATTPRAVPTD
ncbi:MAG: hypothetical protein OXI18_06120 [bacterium]|nr:hypothetical protein [bacterium]